VRLWEEIEAAKVWKRLERAIERELAAARERYAAAAELADARRAQGLAPEEV
jgi:hypothetical protein